MTYLKSNKTNPLNEAKFCTMGVYEALDYIRTKRGIARPNPGFMKQLVQFEKQMSETQENIDNLENENDFNNKVTNSIIELTQSLRSINKENSPA